MATIKLETALSALLLACPPITVVARDAAPADTAPATNSRAGTNSATAAKPPVPKNPIQFFNTATRDLTDGKLDEAEVLLQRVLGSQQEYLAGPSLYNLGHVRFDQGIAELKKSPSAGATSNRARQLASASADAIKQADDSMASNELQKMVQAYMRGRGIRKEIKAATTAVNRALEVHGVALGKWQRSSGDFKSAVELNKADADSTFNSDVVDRSIAKLIDSIREMKQQAQAMNQKGKELGEKMKELKGRIPAQDMPPGASGDEEEDEQPFGQKPEQQEAPGKDGNEIPLSPELAGWLLEGFRLDSDRRLPMTMKQGEARQRSGPTW